MLIFLRKIFICLLLLMLYQDAASAACPDTILPVKAVDTVYVRKFAEEQFFCTETYSAPDSLLDNFQRYFPKNSLGNPGTAIVPVLLPYLTPNAGFNYWLNNFDYYLFKKDEAEYYYTRNPYTNIYLASGTKEEQYFKARHTQNINRQLNMAVGMGKLRSQGDYLRQAANHTNVFLSSNYLSRSGKYFLLANIVYNNLKVQENGGIASDSTFEEFGFSDKKLLEVNLSSAQRRIWNKGVYLKQGISYGNEGINAGDSTKRSLKGKGALWHSISLEDNSLTFIDTDPDSAFYENILRDSTETRDSVYYWKIENEFAWTVNDAYEATCSPKLQLSIAHQFVRVKQNEIDSAMQNFIGRADATGTIRNYLTWNAHGEYVFAGAQQNDLHAMLRVKKVLRDSANYLEFYSTFSDKNPEFIFNRYSSNHFEWSYDWNRYKALVTSLSFTASKLKLSAGVTAVTYDDPLFFDVKARPKQYSGSINAYSTYIKKDFKLGKWVFANTVRYQYIPDSTVIRLPAVVSENAVYYANSLFKGKLGLQAGVDIFYTSSFMGKAYMPVTAQYYIQNDRAIGNYPYVDVFVNLKIKTVKAFLKYEHANAGFMGNTYYLVPHYPLYDASFVFGLSWDFYN